MVKNMKEVYHHHEKMLKTQNSALFCFDVIQCYTIPAATASALNTP